MSLSRSPSPRPNGGWASPGLTDLADTPSTRRKQLGDMNGFASGDVHWAAAKARSEQVRGYPSIQSKNEGFFQRSRRKISATLPTFNRPSPTKRDWSESEKLGRGRWYPRGGGRFARIKTFVGSILRRFRFVLVILALIALTTWIVSVTNLRTQYRRNSRLGGGSKFVIILAANEGGGVMEWKGPREWAIERDSVRNKRRYAERWGYDLEIVDMSTKKRYAHEWRESWEKVDVVRYSMTKYPHAEWFWWLDLNTFIMEPSYSLQSHIFNDLASNTYRDINHYNPLKITHPPHSPFLDPVSTSPTADNSTASIDLIIPQDCSGFNLGSFFMRRSPWSDRLLDIWWDPVLYEQKHMEWEHKEQDALEHLYTNQPWVRTHTAFIPQRKINSFPPAACGKESDEGEPVVDPNIHYDERGRDFMVNMAGCEWGRDCWGEMYYYRELSNQLNRGWWGKVKAGVKSLFERKKKTAQAKKDTADGQKDKQAQDEEKTEQAKDDTLVS